MSECRHVVVPFNFAGGANTMDVVAPTGTGKLIDADPKYAIAVINNATTAETLATHSSFCIGVYDGTTQRCQASVRTDNANGETNRCASQLTSDFMRMLEPGLPPTSKWYGRAEWLTGNRGVKVRFYSDAGRSTPVNAAAFSGFVVMGNGADITNVKVDTINVGGTAGAKAVTGFGFQPDVLMSIVGNAGTVDAAIDATYIDTSVGVAVRATGTPAAHSSYRFGYSGSALAQNFNVGNGTPIVVRSKHDHEGQYGWRGIPTFDADGFTITTDERLGGYTPASPYLAIYMAIKLGSSLRADVVSWQAPTAPGSKTVTGAGFTPSAAVLAFQAPNNMLDNGGIDTNTERSQTLGAFTAYDEASVCRAWKSGEYPIVANSFMSNSALKQWSDVVATGLRHDANLTAFNSDGFALNYATAAQDGGDAENNEPYGWALVFEADDGGAPPATGYRGGALLMM